MPGREHPELKEAEIARNWPSQLEHYRKAFNDMKQKKNQPTNTSSPASVSVMTSPS